MKNNFNTHLKRRANMSDLRLLTNRAAFVVLFAFAALQTVLADGKNWMASLPDNVYITQLSIPGAHDAATSGVSVGLAKTQTMTISEQWDVGVRAFDLRPKKDGIIYHGIISTGISLSTALGYLKSKLQTNPQEFAIVIMRNESDGGQEDGAWPAAIRPILLPFNAEDGNYKGLVEWNNHLRLGDVRGKILMLTRDEVADSRAVSIGSWPDDPTYAMTSIYNDQFRLVYQDKYSDGHSDTKKNAIRDLIKESMTIHNPFRLYLNYISASGSLFTPPASHAPELNKCASDYLDAYANVGPTGIIMMDYAGDGNNGGNYGASLVNKIIANNNANTQLPVFEGPAGEYFLQNVETGLWVQGYQAIPNADRARWNTAANMGSYGRPFLLQNFADDDWTLNTQAGNEILGCGYGDGGLMYLDWASNEAKRWRITGTKDAAHINTWWDRWLSVNDDNILMHDPSAKDTWKLWTREERIAALSEATEENPIDVTWLMVNPELMNNDNMRPQWQEDRSGGGQGWQDGFRPNRIYETWNYTSMDFHQTIDVPNGRYEVQAYALFSPTEGAGTNINDYNDYVANGDATVNGYLYANGEQVKLPSIYSFTSPTPVDDYAKKDLGGVSIIDGWWQAARAMGEDGAFHTQPLRVDVVDGTLRLGIKETNDTNPFKSHWIIIGSFSLKYLGPANVDVVISKVATDGTNNYGTLYYGDRNLVAPEGISAYTAKVNGSEIVLSEVNGAIPAGTAVVLKTDGKLSENTTFKFGVTAAPGSASTDNMLHGTDEATTISGEGYKYYMLSLNGESVPESIGFYYDKNSNGGTQLKNGAHKAYLAVPVSMALAKGYPFGGNATGIEGLIVNGDENAAEVYDLQGRKLQNKNLPKGIYIVNGKKVVR